MGRAACLSRETGGKMLEARAIFQVMLKSILMETTMNKVMKMMHLLTS